MSKRRTHSPEFKARVPMEAISGRKTIQEIAADYAVHPIQVSQWKRQLLDGASELFKRGKKTKDKEEGQAKEAELFQQIGRLQMELEWLKQNGSAALMPVNCASWLITTTPSSPSAGSVRHPCSGSRLMVDYLAQDGIPISRERVRNLMRRMGLRAIYQKPRTSFPGDPSVRFPSLVDLRQIMALDQV